MTLTTDLDSPGDVLIFYESSFVKKRPDLWGGKTRTRTLLDNPDSRPLTVEELARNINIYFWYHRQVSEGTKIPIGYGLIRYRIILFAEGPPQKAVWLLLRRSLGGDPQYSYFINNAASDTKLKTLVWLNGLRWAIEQYFEKAKIELSMDQYEVRKLPGWQYHMLTCVLTYFFLWHLIIRMGKSTVCLLRCHNLRSFSNSIRQ